MRRKILSYDVGAAYNSYMHYGVDTALIDTVDRETMTHPFFRASAEIGLRSSWPDSSHFAYDGNLRYDFFTHAFDQMEHAVDFDLNLDGEIQDFRVGGDLGVEYFNHQASWDPIMTNQFMIHMNPYISRSTAEWSFKAGLNTYWEVRNGVLTPHLHLNGKFSFNIVKDVLVPYFGVGGYQDSHSYREAMEENPYLTPGTVITPTNYKFIVYGGLKGKLTDYLAWNISASYSAVEDMHYFAMDTLTDLQNQFGVVYDDLTIANVHGELNIAPMADLKVFLKGNYYQYANVREDYAWYKPSFDASVQARYNLGDKIFADAGVMLIGPRHYRSLDATLPFETLKTSLDLNIGAEYRYTKLLSFWMKLNNVTAQPYYQWQNYPSYRFRIMAGFTYGL